MMGSVEKRLREEATEKHRVFMQKLLPTLDPETILGVRVADIRRIGKETPSSFLHDLPHTYFEENMLHAFLINALPFDEVFDALASFSPYLDNWAVVDGIDPKAFYGGASSMPYFLNLARDSRPFVARLGIVLALYHIDEDPKGAIEALSRIHSEAYYVQMALAWFFAEAVLHEPEAVVELLEDKKLDLSVHQKTIRKIRESRRVSQSMKDRVWMERRK